MLRLHYFVPASNTLVNDVGGDFTSDGQWKLAWLYYMVESAPDAIFFYTVDSTDID